MAAYDAESRRVMSERTSDISAWRLPNLRLTALAAAGLAAFLVGWLMLGGADEEAQAPRGASVTSEQDLRAFADSAGHPVYWAGRRGKNSYELTRTSDGRVFVRYLPQGVAAGDPRPNFLTVATYPRTNAFAELKRASRAEGAVTRKLPNGGIAVYNADSRSVYFGFPDAGYQVEVYHPGPEIARSLVLAGEVVPIR